MVLLIVLTRVPGRLFGPAPRPPETGSGCGVWLGSGRGGPEEAGELACDRDDGHVVRFAARAHLHVDVVESVLSAVCDREDVQSSDGRSNGRDNRAAGVRPREVVVRQAHRA